MIFCIYEFLHLNNDKIGLKPQIHPNSTEDRRLKTNRKPLY